MSRCCRILFWLRSTRPLAKLTRKCNRPLAECSAALGSPDCDMTNRFVISAIAFVTLTLTVSTISRGQSTLKEVATTMHAARQFDVKITPHDENSDAPLLNRMTLEKQYHGDLEAPGKGKILTAGTEVKGSGAYVAIEKV